jgi:hypothetical protein
MQNDDKYEEPTNKDYDKVRTRDRTKSIWDDDVDFDKVLKLPLKERTRLFPNDFNVNGVPYGDF